MEEEIVAATAMESEAVEEEAVGKPGDSSKSNE